MSGPQVAAMTARHGPADENLLQIIAQKEQELDARVNQAKEQARRIIEQARQEAEVLREQARRDAAAYAEQVAAQIARESEAITAQRLQAAQAEAERIRTLAAERMPEAVRLVVQRVLGGLLEQ